MLVSSPRFLQLSLGAIILQTRLIIQGALEIVESTLKIFLLLAEAAKIVVGQAHKSVFECFQLFYVLHFLL